MKPTHVLAAALLGSVVLSPASAGAVDPPTDAGKAKELFDKGNKAYEAGRPQEAYVYYRQAWDLQQSYDIAGNLAAAELEIGRPRDACEHASFAVGNVPPMATDKQRKFLRGLFEDAKRQVALVTFTVSADGAEILLDGKRAGASPMKQPLCVAPGEHKALARADGKQAEVVFVARPNESKDIVLTLAALRADAPPAKTVVPPAGSSPPPPAKMEGYLIGGFTVAGLGLGAGAALAIVANIKGGEAEKQADALRSGGPNACAGSSPPAGCVTLHDMLAERDRLSNASMWVSIAAGAVGAATLVVWLVQRSQKNVPAEKRPPVSAGFVPAPGGGGVFIQGGF